MEASDDTSIKIIGEDFDNEMYNKYIILLELMYERPLSDILYDSLILWIKLLVFVIIFCIKFMVIVIILQTTIILLIFINKTIFIFIVKIFNLNKSHYSFSYIYFIIFIE